jgi:hypothetical protein
MNKQDKYPSRVRDRQVAGCYTNSSIGHTLPAGIQVGIEHNPQLPWPMTGLQSLRIPSVSLYRKTAWEVDTE